MPLVRYGFALAHGGGGQSRSDYPGGSRPTGLLGERGTVSPAGYLTLAAVAELTRWFPLILFVRVAHLIVSLCAGSVARCEAPRPRARRKGRSKRLPRLRKTALRAGRPRRS